MPIRRNITIDEDVHERLKQELPAKGISRFINVRNSGAAPPLARRSQRSLQVRGSRTIGLNTSALTAPDPAGRIVLDADHAQVVGLRKVDGRRFK